jgi:monofunctional biosynthetic peptidoglycan transglycosylase
MTSDHPLAGLAMVAVFSCCAAGPAKGPEDRSGTHVRDVASQGSAQEVNVLDLADLRDGQTADNWRIVNDGVMGGRSQSQFGIDQGLALFSGTVSPENGGGFASVRTDLESPTLREMVAISMRVRGDGKRYQFRIRTLQQWDGPAYKSTFATTAGEWVEVTLPLTEFQSTFRGRPVPDAPAIDPVRIRQIGFLIADKQWGGFRLEVDWIRAVMKPSMKAAVD